MIKPINVSVDKKTKIENFKADNHTIDKTTGEYKDPLMKWPLRGAAFTNEVGEALRPLIGNYATLSWIPALLYIGADVYDKYKNDQTEYSPNSRRCLKQAIFQGMASVFLPLIAVKAGQNMFSQFGKFTEDKITLNSKEHISKIAEEFIANGKMRAFDGKDEECVKEFLDRVSNTMDFKKQEESARKPLQKLWYKIEEKIAKMMHFDNKENVGKYSEKTIRDLIQLRKDLLKPTVEMKKNPWYSNYIASLKSGQTESVAVKSVLSKFQKSKMMKSKFVKTIGGFAALGLAIKPIDHFVEEVLIGKYVSPGLEYLEKRTNTADIRKK